MMHIELMIRAHPVTKGRVSDALIRCIEECYACAQTCTACADACLSERAVDELRQCIRLNLDCADICSTTGNLASRQTGPGQSALLQMLETCAAACSLCGDECARHAERQEHCRVCAEACRSCAQACREASGSVH